MSKLIAECPVCHGELKICALKCADCGLELRNDFKLSEFDLLSEEDYKFLICFLKNKGSLKSLQEEMGISYPYAKKKLDTLLVNLGLAEPDENIFTIINFIYMIIFNTYNLLFIISIYIFLSHHSSNVNVL